MYNLGQTSNLAWSEIFKVFLYGSRMDVSSAGYLTMIPGILLVFTTFIKPEIIGKIIKWYTFVILLAITFLGILDVVLYQSWGTRLNAQILPYLANPKGMLSCVNFWEFLLIITFWVAIVIFFLWIFRKLIVKNLKNTEKPMWLVSPVLLILSAALMLPIRGSLKTSPLNFSSVYFSRNLFANQSAYNFFWSFNYGWMHNKMAKNPLPYFDDNTCLTNMQGIDQLNQEELPVYIKSPNGKPVNVVMIILESFSNNVIGKLGGTPGVTPCFDEFCDDGILFSSFYATGSRSDKGLSSLLGSYPALMKTTNLLQEPEKMKKIVFLPEYFGNWGYDLSFYYGGDIDFFNTSLMLIQSGVQKIISDKDFSKTISSLQRWGVPDEYLFQRMESDLRQMKKPFFSIAYTLSSHEPFDVPKFKRITESTVAGQYKNAIAYSDSCLGQFINDLKKTPLWKNTIVIITADHASLYAGNFTFEEPISYRIPMLWIGGAVDTSFICNNICMQTDLTSTLLQQLGEKQKPSWFSKNIFGSRQYAFFIGNEGWGFISPETAFYRNLESGKQRFFYGEKCSAADSLDTFSKSFMQFLHKDFIEK